MRKKDKQINKINLSYFGIVSRGRKKWPIADRRVSINDPINHCGTHFGSYSLLVSKYQFVLTYIFLTVKGLNPGVISNVGWVWSSGWTYVLNRTVVVDSDWRFDNLCGSHLQSQSELYRVSWWYYIYSGYWSDWSITSRCYCSSVS